MIGTEISIRRKLVVGNWKMHGLRSDLLELQAIEAAAVGVDVIVCPPFPLIAAARSLVSRIAIGAQACHWASHGAHSGQVSAAMIADAGADWVLVGHSESRTSGRLDNSDVAARVAAAVERLRPIVCVGEATRGQSPYAVADQMIASIPARCDPTRLSIAYEPVWAIGSNETPSDAAIDRTHVALRSRLIDHFGAAARDIPILYGGSVNSANAGTITALQHVDGVLVGGASLRAATFVPVLAAVADNHPRKSAS